MNEKALKGPVFGAGSEKRDLESSGSEPASEMAPAPAAPSDEPGAQGDLISALVEGGAGEAKKIAAPSVATTAATDAGGGEPPVDWFEPLEEDDEANTWDSQGRKDPEEESLAGESEKSGSVASHERPVKTFYQRSVPRRKRTHPDEGWEECPELGDGWKRKENIRRSGSSVGQKDVYYLSPRGDRVRSKVELVSALEGITDLSMFDYKSGKFLGGHRPLPRRGRRKRNMQEISFSESSQMERGEGLATLDRPGLMLSRSYRPGLMSTLTVLREDEVHPSSAYPRSVRDKVKPPQIIASRPLPSTNGGIGSEDTPLICAKCGCSFTGTYYDKQRKRPSCSSCYASKMSGNPSLRFRKWIPCGQCVACLTTDNCGICANCKHGLQSPLSSKRICRRRKCLCPIRKDPGSGNVFQQGPHNDVHETYEDSQPSYFNSDTEDFSVSVDVDDEEDLSTDDDDDWHKKRKRRSCGKCKACLCRKDCGTCDFCIDKPKFGGSNKKRQKCRLRQCQRQAMRHLLPFQLGQADYVTQELQLGRPKPHYTYSRKTNAKKSTEPTSGTGFSDNEDDDSNLQATHWSSELTSGNKHAYELNCRNPQSSMQVNHSDAGQRIRLADRVPNISNHNGSQLDQWDGEKSKAGRDGEKHTREEVEELPMITQIFSLAENPTKSGVDTENHLLKLLEALRASALPFLWYAIVVEGPQLQLIQCSKKSSMADTIVLVDPGFSYKVTVQKQPLLITHPLYDKHPMRLTTVTEVVSLLIDLEKYTVCQGLPSQGPSSDKEPIIFERASTCDFLVMKNINMCANCKALCGQ